MQSIDGQSSDAAECAMCGAQLASFQYCINCGHDSFAETRVEVAADGSAVVDEPTQTVIDVYSSPEARDLAAQLAALVAAQSRAGAPGSSSTLTWSDPAKPARSGRRRPRLTWVLVASLVAFAVGGVALARAYQEPARTAVNSGALMSAEDKPAAGGSSPDRVVCWDGKVERALDACGTPSGLRGLAWVFPSIQPEECEAIDSVGRPQAWSCPYDVGSEEEASIVYGELFSVDDGLNHYTRLYENGVGTQKVVGERYVWKADRRNARALWQRSSMYVNQPWSVHVEGEKKRGVRLAFKSVEFRTTEQLPGLGATE